MTSSPQELAEGYFDAWSARDPERLRPLLADTVRFEGPLATVTGADDYVGSIHGLFQATRSVAVVHRWVDGADVLTWFVLTVGDAEPVPVASWIHGEDGAITHVRVAFDPRGML